MLSVNVAAQSSVEQADLLRLPLLPVGLMRQAVPLTKALEQVGIRVRNGYVLFGIEVQLADGKEPTVNLDLQPGVTLGDALQQIFGQLPHYGFARAGKHLINVYPSGAERDPQDVLNIRVDRLDVVDVEADSILTRPKDFIPELKAALTPKQIGRQEPGGGAVGEILRSVGYEVTLHLRNVTVRQILNAVTEQTQKVSSNLTPLGWIYSFQPDARSPVKGVHTWNVHWSVAHSWKEKAEKGKNPSH